MTVDSAYYPEWTAEDGDTEFSFEIESIGETAMQIFITFEDGVRVEVDPT